MKLVIGLVWQAVEQEGGSNPLGNTNNCHARDWHGNSRDFQPSGH